MSSYNNVQKIKYTKNPSDVVALREYIVFEDSQSQEKYIVFKFINNLNQTLRAIKFEVMQYDENNELLEKSIVLYDKFSAESNAPFVPNAKLKANFKCKSITVNLIAAFFDRIKWVNGAIVDNSYKFDHYANSLEAGRTPVVNAAPAQFAAYTAPAPVKAKLTKQEKKQLKRENKQEKKFKRKNKNGFGVQNIFRKNRVRFPKVFNAFVCILVIGFVAATLVYFTRYTSKVTIDGFDLKLNGGEVNVIGYDGLDTEITIPSQLDERNVIKLGAEAFKDGKITKLVIDTSKDIVIEEGAFLNCKQLKSVTAGKNAGKITVMENAFGGCTALEEVILPTAVMYSGVLPESPSLKQLSIDSLINTRLTLKELFGNKAPSLNKLTLNAERISSGFFAGIQVKEIIFTNKNLTADYGAFKNLGLNNYTATDSCEILDGAIVTVNVENGEFTLPRGVKSFAPEKFSRLKEVTKLTVNAVKGSGIKLNQSFFTAFPNISELEIADASLIEDGALSILNSLEKLSVPAEAARGVKAYLGEKSLKTLKITGTQQVSEQTFAGLEYINELEIDTAVTDVSRDAFKELNVTKLIVPYFGHTFSQASGISNITLVPKGANTVLEGRFFAGMDALRSIVIEEGFIRCGQNLVSGLKLLNSITFPQSATSYSLPAIGSGCTALTNVTVGFTNSVPAKYSAFNYSSEYTTSLSVEFTKGSIPADFFNGGVSKLNNLYLRSAALGGECKGLFKELDLNYLQIKTDNILGVTLAEMFGENSSAYLSTLVMDCVTVPDAFFKDISIMRLLLLSVASVSQEMFDGSNISAIYFTKSLSYNVAFLNVLKNISTKTFYFKGSEPKDVIDTKKNYFWDSDVESLIYKF